MKLSELANTLNSTVAAPAEDFEVTGISTLEDAGPTEITFVTDRKFLAKITNSSAGAVLISEKLGPTDRPHIALPEVWKGILQTLKIFHPGFARKDHTGIHPSAIIDPTANLANDVTVAPLAVIGANVTIASGTYIGPGVVIASNCKIAENCTIYANTVLESETTVGRGVYIKAGAVIGGDGFKYELLDGKWTKIPQVGNVVLADDVEIGSNTCIDRASYSVTTVGENTKIDNLVQIAHNVQVGKNCVIVSQTGIAGSSRVGNNTILAAQVGISDNITIGNNVVIFGKTGVRDTVKDGETRLGSPGRPFTEEARIMAAKKKLPQMATELKRLTKKVAELEELINKLTTD